MFKEDKLDTGELLQQQEQLRSFRDFSYPTQDDYERANDKAQKLLQFVLPEHLWLELKQKGEIRIKSRKASYVILAHSQTEIRDSITGRQVAYGCLQFSILAPDYDRMIAEYLLIKNDEQYYWKRANIFFRKDGNESGIAALFLIVFDVALFVNLALKLLAGY